MNLQFVCEMKRNTAHSTLCQVNIYEKPDTGKSLLATPPVYLSHLRLMFGLKQTELEPMQGEYPKGIQRVQYIKVHAVFLVPFGAVQVVPLCPVP